MNINLKVQTLILITIVVQGDETKKNIFDWDLYRNVLNPELCQQQLEHIVSRSYLLDQFLDASMRIPRGIMLGNFFDLGNYFECLDINTPFHDSHIEGKYCVINVPMNQTSFLVETELQEWNALSQANQFDVNDKHKQNKFVSTLKQHIETLIHVFRENKFPLNIRQENFRLALCIPKPCSSKKMVDIFFNFTAAGLEFTERYCRLPNDKPWVTADYLAIVIFSLIGILTILGTIYDVRHSGRDPKLSNAVFKSFSFYANLQRLTTYNSKSGFLECLDGIRVCAMVWVIIGHSSIAYACGRVFPANPLLSFKYITSPTALWISSATISVDSFLVLSGLLVVYVTRGKLTSTTLLKNIHIFYLSRILRMFPILATVVLLQASVLHRVVDGPNWETVAYDVHNCRERWWYTLLYVQNIFESTRLCLNHSWYLAVDVQLHILSPLVLYWVLSKRRSAWIALVTSITVSIIGSAIYNFIMEFPSGTIIPTRLKEIPRYYQYHYFNTFCRASPFFIGMMCGYLLSLCRKRTVNITKGLVGLLWLSSMAMAALVIYSMYPVLQMDWDNQVADSIINSFTRPMWALSLSWMIFACVHGYAEPINSFLSHGLWKLPARLSYGMYLFHYPIITVIGGTAVAPWYFNVPLALFRFLGVLTITMGLSFIATVLIDAPFSELIRIMLSKFAKRKPRENTDYN